MDSSEKIILDLCGGTGGWSRPYKEAGYDVRIITLPRFDVMDIQLNEKGATLELWDNDENILKVIHVTDIHGIFAAPPCTMFSLARTTAKTPRDLSSGMEIVKKCLEIIWFVRCHKYSNLKFWSLENPVGYLRQLLGKPFLTYQPNEYGDNYTKKTDIWGYFKTPIKNNRKLTEEEITKCSINNRDLPLLPDGYRPPDGKLQAARRAITSKGFAQAFYKANQ